VTYVVDFSVVLTLRGINLTGIIFNSTHKGNAFSGYICLRFRRNKDFYNNIFFIVGFYFIPRLKYWLPFKCYKKRIKRRFFKKPKNHFIKKASLYEKKPIFALKNVLSKKIDV
jgi:hypothetical protein